MASRELVPNTPTSTAPQATANQVQQQSQQQVDSVGQSYLWDALGKEQPREAEQATMARQYEALDATHNLAAGADKDDNDDNDEDDEEPEAEASTILDSQISPEKKDPDDEVDELLDSAEHSHSQPQNGPEDDFHLSQIANGVSESLGRTQHEKETFMRHPRRQSRLSEGSGETHGTQSGNGDRDGEEEEERGGDETASASVSMDLTKAEGRVLHAHAGSAVQPASLRAGPTDTTGVLEETMQPTQIVNDVREEDAASPPKQSDSQKENASPSRVPSRPSSAAAAAGSSRISALAVRNSHVNIDDAYQNGPSSSPAVERELLHGRLAITAATAKRPPFQTGAGMAEEPASSADPDISPSVLLSPREAPILQAPLASSGGLPVHMSSTSASGEGMNTDGPITSTPAFLNARPPDPSMAATRTVPNLAVSPNKTQDPSRLSRNATEPADTAPAPFATSSAMRAAPPTKPKKRHEPWDDLSQDSRNSLLVGSQGSAQTSKPSPGASQVKDGDVGVSVQGQTSVGAEESDEQGAGVDDEVQQNAMDVEESIAATVPHEDSMDVDPSGVGAGARKAALQVAAGGDAKDTQEEGSSLESGPKRPTGQPALFGPESTASSQSQSFSQYETQQQDLPNASAPDQQGKKRLSDISELRSSSEIPPTQYEVAATQKEYDVFRSSAGKSQDVAFDNADRWHASFQVQDKNDTSQRNSPAAPPPPAPGRALKRRSPPPSPVRNGALSAALAQQDETTESQRFGDADESARPIDQHANISTLVQATQRMQPVPESSPEVPLAKRARRAGPSTKASVSFAAGVIPDSDGASPARPVAGPSRAANVPADEPEDELSPLNSPRRSSSTSAPAPTPVTEPKETTKAKPAPKSKGKGRGRGRVLDSTESNDVLDLLADAGAGGAPPQEETNYDELPTARNATKSSSTRRTSGGARAASPPLAAKSNPVDKGKRRADEVPTSEGDAERSTASSRKKKRTISRASVDFDLDIIVGPTSSPFSTSSKASPPKKPKRASTTPAPPTEKAAPTTKKKGKVKAEPKRRSTTGGASTRATASPAAEEQPVAGPSRRRSAASDASAREASVDIKPRLGRLPESAPFTRIFGLWRDDFCFYSGTITAASTSTEKFSVQFDDGNGGKLKESEIRYCRLEEGDHVMYFGATGDNSPDDDQRFVVVSVERAQSPGADTEEAAAEEPLMHNDLVTIRSSDGTEHQVALKDLFIPGNRASQLENRRPTLSELNAFDVTKSTDAAPKLAAAPKPFSLPAMAVSPTKTSIFCRTAFITTKADRLRDGRSNLELKDYGATVIEWPHLFRVRAPADLDAPPEVEFQTEDFAEIDEIFLLSDKHCSTPKYLAALALGIPCLSPDFVLQSVKDKTRLPWQNYVLPAGHLISLDTVAVGSMYRAMMKTSFDLGSLEQAYRDGGVFAGCSFLMVYKPFSKSKPDAKEKEAAQRHHYQIYALLACASARLVHFTASLADAKSAAGYDLVLLVEDQDTIPAQLKSHKGLVTVPWVKQCLMAGKRLQPARLREEKPATGAAAGSGGGGAAGAADHE
ncbi:hypothetical protein JCM10908_004468 [Rhodotorula pacifica]|uniref:uncharacterized protein n=1 Tax=Rhodotorula pacifica TaxID=1495444 RepID=UPI003174C39D